MIYGDIKATFKDLLNRSDCEDAQVTRFIDLAITRIQRELRVPSMERVVSVTATTSALTNVQIPYDFLQLKDILVDDAQLEAKTVGQIFKVTDAGSPAYYCRVKDHWVLRPSVPVGSEVVIIYYGEFEEMTSDSHENELAAVAPDLIIYGALSFAGDHFEHDKRAEWEARYQSIKDELNEQAEEQEWAGGTLSIQPTYSEY